MNTQINNPIGKSEAQAITASIIEINLSEALERDGYMFHCPLTGMPIVGDRDEAFEQFTSPYFLFAITSQGLVFSRNDELPGLVGEGLKAALKALADVGGHGPDAITTHDLHTFMTNVLADCLPDSAVIFEIDPPADRQYGARLWVAMDFTLPATRVDERSTEHQVFQL